jgi:hypothetical protein
MDTGLCILKLLVSGPINVAGFKYAHTARGGGVCTRSDTRLYATEKYIASVPPTR